MMGGGGAEWACQSLAGQLDIGALGQNEQQKLQQTVADNFAAFAKDTKLTARTRCQDVNGSSEDINGNFTASTRVNEYTVEKAKRTRTRSRTPSADETAFCILMDLHVDVDVEVDVEMWKLNVEAMGTG
ncbi:hypothetical protein ACLKA7_011434 [Drosophila subpalustris]